MFHNNNYCKDSMV